MLLNFDKPKKARSTEDHNNMHSADCIAPGTYVPNMSDEDNERWKCKHVTGANERVEIRRWIGGVNLVILVYKDKFIHPMGDVCPDYKYRIDYDTNEQWEKANEPRAEWVKLNKPHDHVKMSMNGSMQLEFFEWEEITQMVEEAREYLRGE